MTFLDANVFLDALLDAGRAGDVARALLRGFDETKPAQTSVLVLDEVHWILRKEKGAGAAVRASRLLRRAPGVRVLAVTPPHWDKALELMDGRTDLKPRDALHAAVALDLKPATIVSTDKDLDGIPGLRRRPPAA